LEKKLSRVGSSTNSSLPSGDKHSGKDDLAAGGHGGGNNLNSDKVMRKLSELMDRARDSRQLEEERVKTLKKDIKIVTQEIQSYNKQLEELDGKESSKGVGEGSKTGGGGLQNANNALKSAIH
jgi:flagellar motility protein MotE (MotC chaperone)